MLKPKLSIDQQIEHMKNEKGIKFNIITEDEAKEFLTNHNYYFRIKAYAKNYEKYNNGDNAGKYINLEFAYLKELSILDMNFRNGILKMVIATEHFLKNQLLQDVNKNDVEDGYNIVNIFFEKHPEIKESIKIKKNNSLNYLLISKYEDSFAIWNIIEVLTFGEFVKLYNLYYSIYNTCHNPFISHIWPTKMLRNAVAHNNCLLHKMRPPYGKSITTNYELSKYMSTIPGIHYGARIRQMKNPIIYDFISSLYLFNKIVTSEKVKQHIINEFYIFFTVKYGRNPQHFYKNENIRSAFDFMLKTINFYQQKLITVKNI